MSILEHPAYVILNPEKQKVIENLVKKAEKGLLYLVPELDHIQIPAATIIWNEALLQGFLIGLHLVTLNQPQEPPEELPSDEDINGL